MCHLKGANLCMFADICAYPGVFFDNLTLNTELAIEIDNWGVASLCSNNQHNHLKYSYELLRWLMEMDLILVLKPLYGLTNGSVLNSHSPDSKMWGWLPSFPRSWNNMSCLLINYIRQLVLNQPVVLRWQVHFRVWCQRILSFYTGPTFMRSKIWLIRKRP